MPAKVNWIHFVQELLWVGAAFASTRPVGKMFKRESETFHLEMSGELEGAAQSAFEEGRSFVITLVSEARYALHRSLLVVRKDLDPSLSDEIDRRLHTIDAQIEDLSCARR
jgi:hypothetical protein